MPERERERERGGNWLQFPFVSALSLKQVLRKTFQKCSSKVAGVLNSITAWNLFGAGGHWSGCGGVSPGDRGRGGREADTREAGTLTHFPFDEKHQLEGLLHLIATPCSKQVLSGTLHRQHTG